MNVVYLKERAETSIDTNRHSVQTRMEEIPSRKPENNIPTLCHSI
jgi:hypothetical protein